MIERKRAEGVRGRLKVKISLAQLMSWVENFVADFNDKETTRFLPLGGPLPKK